MAHVSQVQIDVSQLSYALEHNNRFAVGFFIPEEIQPETPVPDFHVEILDDMMSAEDPYYCCAVPRDHAKTTLAKIAVCKYLSFKSTRFVIYVSNTTEVAANAVRDIANYLRSSNYTMYHDGTCGRSIRWLVEQESHGYYEFIMFEGTAKEKKCILKALGAGKQVRGLNVDNQRPDLAVVDDLETTEQLESEMGYTKLKRWFYGTFLKALDKISHKILQLGNMTAWKCLVHDHVRSKFWRSVCYGAILANGTPLWPEVWSLAKLARDFEFYKEQGMTSIWFAEMMNMPIADGLGLIKEDEIRYHPEVLPEECEYTFITVDPAISSKSWGHKTGIAVHGYVENIWVLVDSFATVGMDPIRLFDKVMVLAQYWRTNVVGIEAVAYQSALKYVFEHLCLERTIEGMQFVDLLASQRKPERFAAYCGEMKAGLFALRDDDIMVTQQMLMFDPKKKENDCDLLDAAAYAVQMISKYMSLIMNTYKGGLFPADSHQSLVDYAEI